MGCLSPNPAVKNQGAINALGLLLGVHSDHHSLLPQEVIKERCPGMFQRGLHKAVVSSFDPLVSPKHQAVSGLSSSGDCIL